MATINFTITIILQIITIIIISIIIISRTIIFCKIIIIYHFKSTIIIIIKINILIIVFIAYIIFIINIIIYFTVPFLFNNVNYKAFSFRILNFLHKFEVGRWPNVQICFKLIKADFIDLMKKIAVVAHTFMLLFKCLFLEQFLVI